MDRLLKTDRFFGCIDIRTGSMFLGFFQFTFMSFQFLRLICEPKKHYPTFEQYDLSVVSPGSAHLISVTGILLSVMFLLGIFHDNSAFLAPQVVCNIILFFVFLLLAVLNVIWTYGVFIPIIFPLGVLIWHITAVPYSLYRKMYDEEDENKPEHSTGAEYQMNVVIQDPGLHV